ncbi:MULTISPECIES: TetR/AcrR family transcriptional regulator [unclassified Nocardioides]|uniref:TetR/AcrR family transcriptional regulator n=1 Tax=unclassified Nocardioides TaxID=2615069 RepID=UPI003014FC34
MNTRMSADDRRELVLQAATRAFAQGGYAGTSTDKVAREAGVSQPYVVRIFGTKLELFLEVFERSTLRIRDAFAEVVDDPTFDPTAEDARERLGLAYTALLADRDLLQVMMHGFSSGGHEEIARSARACMARIFETVRRTGWSDDDVRDFVAHGMLINVMIAMRAPEHVDEDPQIAALAACAFGDALEFLT